MLYLKLNVTYMHTTCRRQVESASVAVKKKIFRLKNTQKEWQAYPFRQYDTAQHHAFISLSHTRAHMIFLRHLVQLPIFSSSAAVHSSDPISIPWRKTWLMGNSSGWWEKGSAKTMALRENGKSHIPVFKSCIHSVSWQSGAVRDIVTNINMSPWVVTCDWISLALLYMQINRDITRTGQIKHDMMIYLM